jgi:hypothetical protein
MVVAQPAQAAASQTVEFLQPLHRVHFLHKAVQDRGSIPRTGADL